jgi:hypothetical protein
MYKRLTAIAVAATIAVATLAVPQAEARRGRIAAGIIGGLAAGAIIGSIAASNRYYYGYGPGYYYGPGPYYGGPYYGQGYYYGADPYAYAPAPVYRGGYYYGGRADECWPCY